MAEESVLVESRDGMHEGQRVLHVTGRLTFSTSSLKFLEQVRVETAPTVILDLSRVSFCDSSGVGALMQIRHTLIRENRRLALAALHDRVRFTLTIAGVLGMLDVFATVEEAETALI